MFRMSSNVRHALQTFIAVTLYVEGTVLVTPSLHDLLKSTPVVYCSSKFVCRSLQTIVATKCKKLEIADVGRCLRNVCQFLSFIWRVKYFVFTIHLSV